MEVMNTWLGMLASVEADLLRVPHVLLAPFRPGRHVLANKGGGGRVNSS